MSDIQKDWLGGFFDAEGYIGVRPYRNPRYRNGFSFIPACQINQAYVAGYFDGEGCMACTVFRAEGRRLGFEIQPHPIVSSTDHDVIRKIGDFLLTKNINVKIYNRRRKSPNAQPQKQLLIYGLQNVKRFLILILPYLHTRKRMQTLILLQQIIPLMERKKHLTKKGFIEIMEYIDLLNDLKGGGKRSIYNANYFRELWGIQA